MTSKPSDTKNPSDKEGLLAPKAQPAKADSDIIPLEEAIDELLEQFDPFENSHNDFIRLKPTIHAKLLALITERERLARADELEDMLYNSAPIIYLSKSQYKAIEDRINELRQGGENP